MGFSGNAKMANSSESIWQLLFANCNPWSGLTKFGYHKGLSAGAGRAGFLVSHMAMPKTLVAANNPGNNSEEEEDLKDMRLCVWFLVSLPKTKISMFQVNLIKVARSSGRYTVAIYDPQQDVTYYPVDRHWYVSAWTDLDEVHRIPTVFSSPADPDRILRLKTDSSEYRDIARQIKGLFG